MYLIKEKHVFPVVYILKGKLGENDVRYETVVYFNTLISCSPVINRVGFDRISRRIISHVNH